MKRYAAWALGAGLMVLAFSAPAKAQVHVDIGVGAPHVGARVVFGAPRVVYVPVRDRRPVFDRYDRWDRGRRRGWDRRDREYVRDVREARRDYERDLREARRDYERDLRDARRDHRR